MGVLDTSNIKTLPFLGITSTPRVSGGSKTAPVERLGYTQPTGTNMFAGVPTENPPVITGGTHINGLGIAGEKFDSYNL